MKEQTLLLTVRRAFFPDNLVKSISTPCLSLRLIQIILHKLLGNISSLFLSPTLAIVLDFMLQYNYSFFQKLIIKLLIEKTVQHMQRCVVTLVDNKW